jgi:hypothetical protein
MSAKHITLSLFHILAVSPFLLYIAIVRGQLQPWMFTLLQILGILILIYHSYRTIVRWRAHSSAVWINLIHVLTVAPLLIYIGSRGYDTPRWAYEVLAMLSFAALGYHLYSIVTSLQEMSEADIQSKVEKRSQETKVN